MGSTIIPIQPAGPSGCGACAQGATGPVCRTTLGAACGAPQLSGPPEQLERLMDALDQALQHGGQPGSHLVRTLRVGDGEAELTLDVASHCAPELMDTAFQTLRRLLPDTDIYVIPAGA